MSISNQVVFCLVLSSVIFSNSCVCWLCGTCTLSHPA